MASYIQLNSLRQNERFFLGRSLVRRNDGAAGITVGATSARAKSLPVSSPNSELSSDDPHAVAKTVNATKASRYFFMITPAEGIERVRQ